MNRSFVSKFNRKTGLSQVVSENTSNTGKTGSSVALPMLAVMLGLAGVTPNAQALCTTIGSVISCTGNTVGLVSSTSNLTVNVQNGAQIYNGVVDQLNAVSLTGTGVTVNNAGRLDPSVLPGLVSLTSGIKISNAAGSTVTVNNLSTGQIMGTSTIQGADLTGLNGVGMVVQNGAGGTTTINNTGVIGGTALLGAPVLEEDMAVMVLRGGARNVVTNNASGIINGRIALQASTLGNTFTNAGSITGSVNLGAGSGSNTFNAVTGSSFSGGAGVGTDLGVLGGLGIAFVPTGIVNAGTQNNGNTLNLINAIGGGSGTNGSGTIDGSKYVNFNNLNVSSGTWSLTNQLFKTGTVNATVQLNGGVLNVDSNALTNAAITANGGGLSAAVAGVNISNAIALDSNGLIATGANNLTLSGVLSGTGQLVKRGSGTLTLSGNNFYTGGTTLEGGTLLVSNNGALGTGTLTTAAGTTLGATNGLTLNNLVNLNGDLTLNGPNNMSLSGVVIGTGNLIKNGNNIVQLAAANTFQGDTILNDGTLYLSNTGSLSQGNLIVNAGTIDSSTAVSIANTITLNGAMTVGGVSSMALQGIIDGNGSLIKGGAANLTLTGVNTYTGGTGLNGGTLTLGNAAAIGAGDLTVGGGGANLSAPTSITLNNAVHLNAGLTLTANNAFILGGVIDGLGSLTKVGTGVLTLNGANNYHGGTMINGGALVVGSNTALGSGTLSTANGTSLDNNTAVTLNNAMNVSGALNVLGSHDLTLSGAISGLGYLSKQGSSTLNLTGTNTYAGTTLIYGGKLAVNGSLTASNITVMNGGTLGGIGAVRSVTIENGGNLAPGNSIGTLTVNGDLTLNSGSTYRVEADAAGNSDKVIVTGTANLNGNIVALPHSGGMYQANTRYTILSASTLNGSFNSTVSSSLAFLDASVSQDTNNVYLNLRRNDIAYGDVAQTRNQRGLATALQNAAAAGGNSAEMSSILTSVNNLSADKARAAFESMSGTGLVGLQRAGTNFAGNFSNQVMGRLQFAGMGSTAQSVNGMQLAANDRLGDLMPVLAQNTMSDAPASGKFSMGGGVPVDDGKRGFWLRGYGFDQDTDGDGNAAGSRIKGVGISAGFDKRIQNNLVIGAAFSHGTSDVRASSAETGKSRGNALAAYASYASGSWTFNGNLMFAHNTNTMNRSVTVGTLTNAARANFDSKTVSAYAETSYDLPQATWTLQPLAGLSVTHNRNDGFTETGAGALNIQADAQSITSTKTLLGARALFEFDGIHVQPRALWSHELGDVNKGLTAQLQGSPAAAFTTYGVDLPRDSFITGLTVAGRTKDGLSLFADVQGEFNSKQTGVALLVGLRKNW